jgi:hypothetical protein
MIIVPDSTGIWYICKAYSRLTIEICGLQCNIADGPKTK